MKRVVPLLFVAIAVGSAGWLIAGRGGGDGFAVAGAPMDFLRDRLGDKEYELSDLDYFRRAAFKINTEYVDARRVAPDAMMLAALDRVARIVPQFVYSYDAESAQLGLTYGSDHSNFRVASLDSLPEMTEVVADTAKFLDERLDDDFERPTIEYALMNGMLSTLDPHSTFIDPKSYKEMKITNRGHFGGLGITIGIRENRLTVLYPFAGTPAFRAGLQPGDRIEKIEQESTVNMTLQEAVSRLRGQVGTPVTITVSSEGQMDREVAITRARITVPSVKSAYAGDGVGYLELSNFAEDTHDQLDGAMLKLTEVASDDGFPEMTGLILDFRGNPGGYLQQAIQISDKFLSEGVIVATAGAGGRKIKDEKARSFYTEDELPLVLLVDESSASASEIVAGALKNHDRAVIMGARTFGKGSVQNLYDNEFHDGALKLTIAKYLTPGDRSIQGIGIVPDIALRPARVSSDEDGVDVRMYWQDFKLREQDLDQAFKWGDDKSADGSLQFVYSCEECWERGGADSRVEPKAEDKLKDIEVQAAKALLRSNGSPLRSEMLRGAGPVIRGVFEERLALLDSRLEEVGIDWSPAPSGATATLGSDSVRATLDIRAEGDILTPGLGTPVAITVTNDSDEPIHRLRAITEGDFFSGREYVFGQLAPGETREFSNKSWPALWLHSRTEEVIWHFFADSGPVPPKLVGKLRITEVPHPRFAFTYQLVDDGTGKSQGNGDGLVQAGESIELLVMVENVGDGATADLWKAERGLLSAGDDADGDGKADKPSAFVRLKNASGDAIFLERGSAWFSLAPGERVQERLHFRVADDLGDRTHLQVVIDVQDTKFLEASSAELSIPLHASSDPIAKVHRVVKPKGAYAEVRSGASALAPIIARLEGPASATGRLSEWFRVPLEWGGSGWVSDSHVTGGNRRDIGTPVLHLSYAPPIVRLDHNPGGTSVVADRIILEGEVTDDELVKDLYIFVNKRKVSYQRLGTSVSAHRFEVEVELSEGENEIEIHARDGQDLSGRLSLSVYRESATAAADIAETPRAVTR